MVEKNNRMKEVMKKVWMYQLRKLVIILQGSEETTYLETEKGIRVTIDINK